MNLKLRKIPMSWLLAVCFMVLGVLIKAVLVGYDTTALICCGIGALIVCYRLIKVLAKKHRKTAVILRRILTVCVCLVVISVAITGGIIVSGSRGAPEEDCDYLIVLGAGVNGTTPSLSLRERLDAAYEYLTAHPDAICVVSGCQGDGEAISEAQCMFNDLTARGIEADRVWMEEQATNTRENLRFSLELVENRTGVRPTEIGIVSSEYHLYRAGLFAEEQNVTAYGIPARTGWVTLRINYYLREIAAVWYYTILGGLYNA